MVARQMLPPAQAKLHQRANDEMKRWRKTLTREARTKLKGDTLSKWARKGGNIIMMPLFG